MSLEAIFDGHASGVCCGVIVLETNLVKKKDEENEEEKSSDDMKIKSSKDKMLSSNECKGSGVLVTGDWSGVCHVFSLSHSGYTNDDDNNNNSSSQCAFGKIMQSYTRHTNAIRGLAHLPHTP